MRFMIRVLGFVVVLAGLGLGALALLPADRIAALAAERLGASLGRAVTLSGDVRPTLWPHLGVRAGGLRVANPDWVNEGPLITAQGLTVRVPWASVMSGEMQIDEITLIAPDITLVRAADGRESWAMPMAGAGAGMSGTAAMPGFGIAAARITGGALRYVDHGTGQSHRITEMELQLGLPLSGSATIAGQARVHDTALSLEASITSLPRLFAGEASAVALSLGWPGGTGRFDGQMGLAPTLEGALSLSATDLGPLAGLFGAAMPDLPRGFGRDRLALSGQVALTRAGGVSLRDGRLVLDDTALALALELIPGEERPLIRGTVSGGRLGLPQSTQAGGAGWSTTPIDVSGLFAADAEIALTLAGLDGVGATLGPVDLRAALTRGRLVIDIARIGLHGGALGGQFVVNGRGGLSVGGDLRLTGVALSPLLAELADYDRLEGTGDARLRFLGSGGSMAQIVTSLSGEGDLALGAGAIRGLDLAGMIRSRDPAHQGAGARTVFDRIAASFTIAGGVLSNDDLRLEAPWGRAMGAGQVDLGAQRLNYRLTPSFAAGTGAEGISLPIAITGPWAAPVIRPDLEALAQQELAVDRARLEAEARARLDAERTRLETEARDRANQLLGRELGQDNTIEDARDALEQRLRDEATQQLRRLLGQGN